MLQGRVGTLATGFGLALALAGSGCSLVLDFDKPPVDAPPDSPVDDTSCMAFEPNESPSAATVLTPGDYMAAICGGETDYFKFTVSGTETVVARITFMNRNGQGDIDLRLLTVNGSATIDESRTSNDEETVMCPGGNACNSPLVAGDYLLQVLGVNTLVQSAYTLNLAITPTPIDAGVD